MNTRCRVSEDLAAHQKTVDQQFNEVFDEDPGQPVYSIFSFSPVVAEPDEYRIEAKRQRIIRQARSIQALNKKNAATKAEVDIAIRIGASK